MNLHDGITSEQQLLARQARLKENLSRQPRRFSRSRVAANGKNGPERNRSKPDSVSGSLSNKTDDSFEDLVLITKDILSKALSDQRAAQTEKFHAQKMESIGQLASGMAHEINTPLQYIGGNLDFISQAFEELSRAVAVLMNAIEESGYEGQHPLRDRKDKIDFVLARLPSAILQSREGVENVSRIVRAMKGFSHPGDKAVESDINQAIESTFTVSKNEWKYVANTKLHLDKSLPKLSCLPSELNQGFLNIIINAAHAIEDKIGDKSTERGLISATTSFDSENIIVRISDTGVGMPEKVVEKIFDPFYTTKEVGKGTGQGLSICHSIFVEKYGGKIDVQSEVGKGTIFTIWLPRVGLPDSSK